MFSYKKHLRTEEDMLNFAALFSLKINNGSVIYLEGPLGAGKTTFARGFLRGLGYEQKVKSPTYTLVEPYALEKKSIFHFDLYRLHDAQELEYVGIQEYFRPDSICLIEWPEKGIPFLAPADFICYISPAKEGRNLQIDALTHSAKTILKQL